MTTSEPPPRAAGAPTMTENPGPAVEPEAPTPPDAPRDEKKPRPRLPALDVLRGIAILGTLLTNIWIFSETGSGDIAKGAATRAVEGAAASGGNWADALTRYLQTGLGLVTDGKFIGLLTIMFGIGLEIQRQAAIRRGEKWPGRYPWRAGLLVLDGLLNYIFIFEYDVLMGYGLTALVVAVIMATSPRTQKIWLGIGITAHLAYITYLSWPALRTGAATETWRSRLGSRGADEATGLTGGGPEATEMARGLTDAVGRTDSYWSMVTERVSSFLAGRGEIPIMFLMGLGLFLVGAHLYRAGLFEEHGAKLRRWVMGLSFGVGLPVDWYLRLAVPDIAGSFPRYVTSSLVAFGVLALVAAFYVRRSGTGPVGSAFSVVGRMALTCYISQNLIASIIFYDWGLGVAAKIHGPYMTYWTLLIYFGIAGLLVAFSALWLRRFERGPVEWAWHRSYAGIGSVLDRRRARKAVKA